MVEPVLAAVLAAGQARRFGGGKLDAACADRPLGCWALQAVERAGLARRVIIVPEQAPRFAVRSGWSLIVNRVAGDGLGTSLACAAQAAISCGAGALLVLLADMPLVDADLLRRLLTAGAPAAIKHAPGRPGVPALLPASAFAHLSELAGDRGAARLLRDIDGLSLLDAPADALLDVDDPAGLQAAARLLQGLGRLRTVDASDGDPV